MPNFTTPAYLQLDLAALITAAFVQFHQSKLAKFKRGIHFLGYVIMYH